MKQDIKNYTSGELSRYLKEKGHPGYAAGQLFSWIYQKRVEDFTLMTNLSASARRFFKGDFYLSRPKLLKREVSRDGTQKFLFGLKDYTRIETVLIPEERRVTLCVSTQAGCKFRCRFCLSGKKGLRRNLLASEIINQYLTVGGLYRSKITNIVFMGSGEPLDNFVNSTKAVKIFTDPAGLALSPRRISLSTCGLVPAIERLAVLDLGIRLSVSLHSADNAARTKIMPINKKYPLPELMKAVRKFARRGRPITFEYILIKDFNASRRDVLRLAKLLRGINCKVNLIPYNSCLSQFKAPPEEEVLAFRDELKKKGIFCILRKARGRDIRAACGQLCSE